MSTAHDGPKPSPIAHMGYSGTTYAGMKAPRPGDIGPAHEVSEVAETTSGYMSGYEPLRAVLELAYDQAARGKGRDRHGWQDKGFEKQPIFDMAKRFGVGSLLAQAFKKMHESQGLGHEPAQRELLGAIVYIAAAYIHNENNKDGQSI